ncbi:hypothetical protein MOKP64_39590 [Mycobacterium avium subsp. hominissuis]
MHHNIGLGTIPITDPEWFGYTRGGRPQSGTTQLIFSRRLAFPCNCPGQPGVNREHALQDSRFALIATVKLSRLPAPATKYRCTGGSAHPNRRLVSTGLA